MSYTTRLNGFVIVKELSKSNGNGMVLVVVSGDTSFTFRGIATLTPDWDLQGSTVKLTAIDGYVRVRNIVTNALIAEMYVEGIV